MTTNRIFMSLVMLLLVWLPVFANAQSNTVAGLYMVDFSGGQQPENVVVAKLTETGAFLSMGMEGKYQLREGGKSIRIELPDEPIVTGSFESNETGFLVRAEVNGAQLVHKYIKLTQVRNTRMNFASLDDAEFFVGGPYLYRRRVDHEDGSTAHLLCIRVNTE